MRSTDDLVTAVRSDTRGGTLLSPAVTTSDVVRYLNYGQERLQSVILKTNPTSFRTDTIITLVANQEEYAVPDRVYADERIVDVKYSFDSSAQYYRDLPERSFNHRTGRTSNRLGWYMRRSKSLLFNPIINTAGGACRVTYERQVDSINVKNALWAGSGTATLTFTLSGLSYADESLFAAGTYICVTDVDGNVIVRNALIGSYNSGTHIATLAANLSTYVTTGHQLGELNGNCGVTVGKYSTTHCQLSDFCERYLVYYTQVELFDRDSSDDGSLARSKLSAIETDIVQTYQDSMRDEQDIELAEPDLLVRCDSYD